MKKIIYFIISITIVGTFTIPLLKALCENKESDYISPSINIFCERMNLDDGTIFTTSLSIFIGGIITTLIFWYQEKGQEQVRVALIEIDLLSKGISKIHPSQKAILYGTLYGFMDLLYSYDNPLFSFKCNKLQNFLNKYLSNQKIKDATMKLLKEFEDKNPKMELKERVKGYRQYIDNYFNEYTEEISLPKNIKYYDWIIITGSKYEDGKVVFPTIDKEVSKDIRYHIKQIKKNFILFKEKIKKDRDIYFSEDRTQNLIVVGGASINKISADLNDKLSIPYAKIINYNDEKHYDYLVHHNYDKFFNFQSIKEYYTIQIIKNPYNNHKSKSTRIIILFGLTGSGTKKAGDKFIEMWKKCSIKIEHEKWAMMSNDECNRSE